MSMELTNKPLTIPQARFVHAFISYGNMAKAVRLAYPEQSKQWSQNYQSLKGLRMIRNDKIMSEIQNRKAVMESNANLGALKLQKIITSGKEHNALEASKFSIEQMDGKATQLKEIKGTFVGIRYDLSGGSSGEIPQSVLDELADGDD